VKQKVEDFETLLLDESFLNYYFQKNDADIWEWDEYQEQFPESVDKINEAKDALNKLSLKWSEDQIREKYLAFHGHLLGQDHSSFNIFKIAFASVFFRAAASILLVLGIFWFYAQNSVSPIYEKLTQEKHLIETINNSKQPKLVLLADGSSVLLKENSRLSYPKEFTADKREVFLDGEAFFEVAKNPQQPFFVFANEIVTKVIGTSFTIVAKMGHKDINVIVNTGKVSVYNLKEVESVKIKSKLEGVIVTENQQIVFDKNQANFTKLLVEQPKIIYLKNNQNFDFIDATATDVFVAIQKAYGVNIVFDQELMKHCPITASLNDEPMLGKIELVCQAIEAEYEVLEGQIVITGKGCKY
jgi:hypothetical protein